MDRGHGSAGMNLTQGLYIEQFLLKRLESLRSPVELHQA